MANGDPQQTPQQPMLPQAASPQAMMPPTAPAMPGQNVLQSSMGPLMQLAQQSMQGPMNQPVPQMGGQIDPMQHPIVAGIIRALASAAQTAGWTGMMPQERMERQQMQQQKAETLANLASTQAYREGMLGYRGGELGVQQGGLGVKQEEAGIKQGQLGLAQQKEGFEENLKNAQLSLAQDANQWKKDLASGNLALAQQRIFNQADQFEQRLQQVKDLQSRGLDIRAYQAAIAQQMIPIREGMLQLGQTTLAQRGTVAGIQAETKLQQFSLEHPILTSMFGLGDLTQMAGQAQQAPMPGVGPSPAPVTGQPPPGAAPANPPALAAPAGGGKLGAKKAQQGQGQAPSLSLQQAQQYLQRAGGDKDKARALARADGHTF